MIAKKLRKNLKVEPGAIDSIPNPQKVNLALQLVTAICNMEFKPDGVEWEITEHNLVINLANVLNGSGGGSGGGGNADFAGLYVPGQTYNAFQSVLIQTGPAAGQWISTADNNTNHPATGINWLQLSSLTQWF